MPPKKLEFNTDSNIHREDLLEILRALDIEWPYEPRLNSSSLRKRVLQGLDFAQDWDSLSSEYGSASGLDSSKKNCGGDGGDEGSGAVGEEGEENGGEKEKEREREKKKIDLSNLPLWKDAHPNIPIYKASRKFSFEEDSSLMDDGTPENILAQVPFNLSPFVGLRRV